MDTTVTAATDLDRCVRVILGGGAYYRGAWFHCDWQPSQHLSRNISIQWQELYAVVAAALISGCRGRFSTDLSVSMGGKEIKTAPGDESYF